MFWGAARDLAKELLSTFVKSEQINLFQNEIILALPLRQPARFFLFCFIFIPIQHQNTWTLVQNSDVRF